METISFEQFLITRTDLNLKIDAMILHMYMNMEIEKSKKQLLAQKMIFISKGRIGG